MRLLKYLGLILGAIFFAAPIIIIIVGSFMTSGELASIFSSGKFSVILIPAKVSLNGYFDLLFSSDEYLAMFWNSVFIAFSIASGNVVISLLVGYALAKIKFKGCGVLIYIYIVVMMMPFQVTLLPNYLMLRAMNLYNTNWALIIPGILSPFGVFMLTQFLRGMPDEMLEAAVLETSSTSQLMFHIVAPMVYPGLLALLLLSFAEAWNMVEQPLILMQDEWRYPLSLAVNNMQSDNMAMAFAGSVLYMAPMILLYQVFEEELIKGLSIRKV